MRASASSTDRISPCPISDFPIRDIRPDVSSSDSTSEPFMWPFARSSSSGSRPFSATSSICPRITVSVSVARDGVVPAYAQNIPVSANDEW